MKIETIGKVLALALISVTFSCEKIGIIKELFPNQMDANENEINVLVFRDSTENDHEMIQMAIDYAHSNAIPVVYVPVGEYMIDATSVDGNKGLVLRNDIHLKMADSTVLKAIPNVANRYYIVAIHDVQHVKISGGHVVGERNEHLGTGGEWGMGIDLRNAKYVNIDSVKVSDCWGDGICISNSTEFVRISNVVSNNNRRQGMSIIDVDSISVLNSLFSNTNGTAPQAGIDIEPDAASSVSRVLIDGCVFDENAGKGLLMDAHRGPVTQVVVTGSVFTDNKGGIAMTRQTSNVHQISVDISNVNISGTEDGAIRMYNVHDITITDAEITEGSSVGVYLYSSENVDLRRINVNNPDEPTVSGFTLVSAIDSVSLTDCEITGGQYGLNCVGGTNMTMDSVRCIGQRSSGIRSVNLSNSVFRSLIVRDSKYRGAYFESCYGNEISNCTFEEGDFSSPTNDAAYIVFGGTSYDNQCVDNLMPGGSATNKARWGVRLAASTYSNLVSGNVIDSSAYFASAISDAGSNNTVIY